LRHFFYIKHKTEVHIYKQCVVFSSLGVCI